MPEHFTPDQGVGRHGSTLALENEDHPTADAAHPDPFVDRYRSTRVCRCAESRTVAVHATALPTLYVESGMHSPLHTGLPRPLVFPNLPAGHKVHAFTLLPPALYVPGAHTAPDALVMPTPQYAPGAAGPHAPSHDALPTPALAPNRPAGHPVHTAPMSPAVYCPGGHRAPVALGDAPWHAHPGSELHAVQLVVVLVPPRE